MSTGEGGEVGDGAREDREDRDHRGGGERIGIGGGDDSVVRIQLAARWAEAYGRGTDSLGAILRRFRAAYEYLDAVTHGVEPADLDREVMESRPVVPPAGGASVTPAPGPPPVYTPPPAPPPLQPGQQPEQRPWG